MPQDGPGALPILFPIPVRVLVPIPILVPVPMLRWLIGGGREPQGLAEVRRLPAGCAGPWLSPLGGSGPAMGRAPGPVSACGAGLIERGTGGLGEKQGRGESTGENQVGALLLEEDIEVLEVSGEGQRRTCRVWTTSPVWRS